MSDLDYRNRTAINTQLHQTHVAVLRFARGDRHSAINVGMALSNLRLLSETTGRTAPLTAGALRGVADLVELACQGAERAADRNDIRRYNELSRQALQVMDLSWEVILTEE